jgi:hypothetical protein
MCLNGIPLLRTSVGNQEYGSCNCQTNPKYQDPYCCDKTHSTYTNFQNNKVECSKVITCSSNNPATNGWTVENKKCSEIDLSSDNCKKYAENDVTRLKNLRCNTILGNKGVVTSLSDKKYNDIFMEALRYPPNENYKDNNKYWFVMKTDRDLSDLLSITDIDARNIQANYGAFFIAHKFLYNQDLESGDNTMTNEDLNTAISNVFAGQNSFAMDKFGNISIRLANNIIKNFQNPLFPSNDEENDINFKNLCENTKEYTWQQTSSNDGTCRDNDRNVSVGFSELCRRLNKVDKYGNFIGNTFWKSDPPSKCYKYFIDTDSSSSPHDREAFLKRMNRNFITTGNRKWILYRDSVDPVKPNNTGRANIQFYLLYNPIHSKSFRDYYRNLSNTADRMNEFIIKKYGELNAEKRTYNVKLRRYGDPTSRCTNGYSKSSWFNLPDCAALTLSDDYFLNEGSFGGSPESKNQYNMLRGSCACMTNMCDMKDYKDSYVNDFQEDIKKYVFNTSKENNGRCPSSLDIRFCNVNIVAAGSNYFNSNRINNDCSNAGIPDINLPTTSGSTPVPT